MFVTDENWFAEDIIVYFDNLIYQNGITNIPFNGFGVSFIDARQQLDTFNKALQMMDENDFDKEDHNYTNFLKWKADVEKIINDYEAKNGSTI